MSEWGGYVQVATFGVAIGYDSEFGVTLSAFQSVSAVVSADAWAAVAISPTRGINTDFSMYAGVGVPTGAPTTLSANLQHNMMTGDTFGTVGVNAGAIGLGNDILEVGFYGEGHGTPYDSSVEPSKVSSSPDQARLDGISYVDAETMLDYLSDNDTARKNLATAYEMARAKKAQELLEQQQKIDAPPCFARGTKILIDFEKNKNIENIEIGDEVLSFDPNKNNGFGELVRCRVSKIFQNITNEWIIIHLPNGNNLTTTPEHQFLTPIGSFQEIGKLLKNSNNNSVSIVDKNGVIVSVECEYVQYNDNNSYLFEESEMQICSSNGAVAEEIKTKKGWKTYNFEVENLHTYIASDIRVHNDCISDQLDKLGYYQNFEKGNYGTEAYSYHDKYGNPHIGVNRDGLIFDFDPRTDKISGTGIFGALFGDTGDTSSTGSGDGPGYDSGTGYGDGMDSSPSGNPNVDQGTSHHGPIVVDLDGDGVELVSLIGSETFFDVDDDNYKELTGWASADDGILAIDNNGDGKIKEADEFIFAELTKKKTDDTDLEAFRARYDSNDDGVFDSNDAKWSKAGIWQDANQDGKCQDGEFKTLDELGIASISLKSDDKYKVVDGNVIHGETEVTFTDSTVKKAADVAFLATDIGIKNVKGGVKLEYGATGKAFFADDDTGIVFNAVKDKYVFVSGGAGNDRLIAGNKGVMVLGNDGHDTIYGGKGDDILVGGIGRDSLRGGGGDDVLVISDDARQANGNSKIENFSGGNGFDTAIYLGATSAKINLKDKGVEAFYSGTGSDTLRAGSDKGVLIDGGDGSDKITGGAGNDVLVGGKGNDTIRGGGGNDDLIVGQGDDYHGGNGIDSATYEDENDLHLNLTSKGLEAFHSGGGDDTINAGTDKSVFIDGGEGADSITGGAGADILLGGKGHDTIRGGGGDDIITVGQGDDFQGGNGTDTAIYTDNNNLNINITSKSIEAFYSGGGNDELRAVTNTGVVIDGGEGNDHISGGGGNDVLSGGTGNDTLVGGTGDDIYMFWRGDGEVKVKEHSGGVSDDDVILLGMGINFTHLEFRRVSENDVRINITDSDGNLIGDKIILTDWFIDDHRISDVVFSDGTVFDFSGFNTMNGDGYIVGTGDGDLQFGGNGDDTLIGGAGDDTQIGGAGDDTLNGGSGDDYQSGGSGDDSLNGGSGNDTQSGGSGDDTLNGGSGNDVQSGGDGDDVINGGSGDDVQSGGNGDDTLNGGSGDDTQYGGNGDDDINGGSGQDVQYGGNGADTLSGGSGSDILNGGGGDDKLAGGDGDDTVKGDGGHDQLSGGDGKDRLEGGNGDDDLSGGNGADTLKGESGKDTIGGGDGNDHINGGGNADSLMGGAHDDTIYGGSGGDDIYGGTGKDSLQGDDGNDYVFGGDGSDVVKGNADNDTVRGGDGNDTVYGGTGNDYVAGGAHADTLYGDDGKDTLYGGTGSDLINAGTDDDTVYGGDGNDIANGDGGNDDIKGNSGDDTLRGDGGNDTVSGGTGNDHINGGDNADTLAGDSGNDTIYGGTGNDEISGGLDDDQVNGDEGADVINGNDGNDDLKGNADNDTVSGDAGDDTVSGGFGDDSLMGGDGNDVVNGDGDSDTLHGDAGDDTLDGGTGADVLYGGADNDSLLGGGNDDTLDGGDGDDYVDGNEGDDSVDGSTGEDTVLGSEGADHVIGGAGADEISGGLGGDSLVGGSGDDTLWGLEDDDTLEGGEDDDELNGGVGNDNLDGGEGFDTLNGGVGLDTLIGGANGDELNGGDDADDLQGGDGFDDLNGDLGDDLLSGGADGDILDGGEGADTLNGDDGDDMLTGGLGDDELNGGADHDELDGSEGADVLSGGAGDDMLTGGDGDDTLNADAGADTLTGGLDSDSFVYTAGGFDHDILTDFEAGAGVSDVIEFSTALFADFDAVIAASADDGTDTTITLDADNTITLRDVLVGDLDGDDFVFTV